MPPMMTRNAKWLTVAALCVVPGAVLAQTPAPAPPDVQAQPSPPNSAPRGPAQDTPSEAGKPKPPLSEKLEGTGGVLKPPAVKDEIAQPPPRPHMDSDIVIKPPPPAAPTPPSPK